MEMLLTCRGCGYIEHGESSRALMAKIRMQNHLHRAHAESEGIFSRAVSERALV